MRIESTFITSQQCLEPRTCLVVSYIFQKVLSKCWDGNSEILVQKPEKRYFSKHEI